MKDTNYLQEVRAQYEHYPYPMRNPEHEKTQLISTHMDFLDTINHYCYRGKQSFANFRVLVAGGGTGDSTIFLAEQLRNHNAAIVYMDISESSMAIAKKRAETRKLKNITWLNTSLLQIPEIDIGTFDYINCSGVLHHLQNPEEGLLALTSVLKDDGCMGLMIYAKYGRTAIYYIQELMRLINKNESSMQSRVRNTKLLLAHLPRTNWFKRGEDVTREHTTQGDPGIYDLFLHSQDRAYSVAEMHAYIEKCRLSFVEFMLNRKIFYRADNYIKDPSLLTCISELSQKEQQAVAELTAGNIGMHIFYVSNATITIASPDECDNIPYFFRYSVTNLHKAIELNEDKGAGEFVVVHPEGFTVRFQPGKYTKYIFQYLDEKRSLREIFNEVRREFNNDVPDEELLLAFKVLYEKFNAFDWMLLRHKSIPAFKTVKELQEPVSSLYKE